MAHQCPICGRVNPDVGERCDCGYSYSAPVAAKPAGFGPLAMFLDLALIVTVIATTGIAVWAIAKVASGIPLELLFLLGIVAWVGVTSSLLRRYCYPNTRVWRATAVSALDPIPAPLRRKLYVAFLSTVHWILGMLLVYVVLARTWHAARFGALPTSLAYDLLHPWSVAPLYQTPIPAPKGGAGPPTESPWWLLPGLGVLVGVMTLAWCGTLETNAQWQRAGGLPQMYRPDLSWARVAAILGLLLFWLPVIGLVAGVVAFWLNRRSPTWTYRAGQVSLLLTGFVHAAIAVAFVRAAMKG